MSRVRASQRGQSIVEFTLVLPVMLILLVGIVDLARIYTTMLSVESAAREAADYGTTLGAGKWQSPTPADLTLAEMQRRGCVASSNLTDYSDPGNDPSDGCANPSFSYCVTSSPGGSCGALDPSAGCENPLRSFPCIITVTLHYDFHLLAPLNFQFMGVQYGIPSTIAFDRDSSFAMTDIDLSPGAP
ncbi:MAG: TadE/TadG family type IV pilus assembly protein [Chloroflexota bacterium]